MMMKTTLALTCLGLSVGLLTAADYPEAEITNGQLRARMYLPDVENGYYRGTRFDWSGVVYSLQYKGHDYYGPWYQKTDPEVRDFVYAGPDIITGTNSAITGPVDAFGPVGWDDAEPSGTFIKVGIGALKKPDESRHDNYRVYEIADPGKWTIRKRPDSVEFTQELADSTSGCGYVYRKTVRLAEGRPQMVLEHRLRNTGTRAIETTVYNHNFLVLDQQPPGPDFVITFPFQVQTSRLPDNELAEIRGNQVVYLKTLENRDSVATPVEGFGDSSSDNQIRIEDSNLGAGMTITGDRPLSRVYLWSIRTTISVEPFVAIAIEPGMEFTWQSAYNYYTLPRN